MTNDMATGNDSKNEKSKSVMGITFGDIHSDEPHESVTPTSSDTAITHHDTRSHLSNKGKVFDVEDVFEKDHVEEGMIVSDKRRRHISFGESLKSAFGEWLGDTKEKLSDLQEKVEEATQDEGTKVPKAETRKDILTKAATHATLAPKDDSKVVIEKIRTYKKDVAAVTGNTITLKNPSTTTPAWKHVAEDKSSHTTQALSKMEHFEAPDLRNVMVAPAVAQKVRSTGYTPTKNTPTPAAPHPTVKTVSENKRDERTNPRTVAPVVAQQIKKELESFSNPHTAEQKPDPLTHVLRTKPQATERLAPTQKPSPKWETTLLKEALVATPKIESDPVVTPTPSVQPTPRQTPQEIKVPEPVSHSPAPEQTRTLPTPEVSKSLPTIPERPTKPPVPTLATQELHSASELIDSKQTLETLATETPSIVSQPFVPQKERSAPSAFVTYAIRTGLITLVIVSGVGLAVIAKNQFGDGASQPAPVATETVLPVSSFITPATTQTVELSGPASTLRETLHNVVMSAPTGITQIQMSRTVNTVSQNVTSKDFLAYLGVQLSQSTQRVLDGEFMIGVLTTDDARTPFIMLRSQNFDALFTGMLGWESTLFDDFHPFFGDTSPAVHTYTDAVRNNLPVRMLQDDLGNEILLYTIVNKNTVIITTSRTALDTLISSM
jgi:hypothetical protein